MIKLHTNTFTSSYELTKFVNDRYIQPEKIQAITSTEVVAGYTNYITYTLFWWQEDND